MTNRWLLLLTIDILQMLFPKPGDWFQALKGGEVFSSRSSDFIFVEANEKSASLKADSSDFSYDCEFQIGRTGLEPVTP